MKKIVFYGSLLVFMLSLSRTAARADAWRISASEEAAATPEIPSARAGTIPANLYSQVLDAPTRPQYSLRLTILDETRFGSYGESDMLEIDLRRNLAYYRNILYGDLDLALFLETRVLRDNLVLELPDMLNALALEVGWLWRYTNGYSFELRAFPGLYGDIFSMDAALLGIPTRLLLHRAIDRDLAGVAGVEIRPGWDRPLMPYGGIAWEGSRRLRCEIMVPRSRVLLYLNRLTLFATAEWRNITYAIDESGFAPDEVTFDEYLVSAGASVKLTDEIHLSLEAGTFLDRDMHTDLSEARRFSLMGGDFIRLGWAGPF